MAILKSIRQNFDLSYFANGKRSRNNSHAKYIELAVGLDTPKIILQGSESQSTGFVVNGSVSIISKSPEIIGSISVSNLKLEFNQLVKYSKPFLFNDGVVGTCKKCGNKRNTIVKKSFGINSDEEKLICLNDNDIVNSIPFSFLVPGDTPATTVLGANMDTSIHYEIKCILQFKVVPTKSESDEQQEQDELITTEFPITVGRSISKTPDLVYLRKFSQTDMDARIVLPSVIYSKSAVPLELIIEGLQIVKDGKIVRKWKPKSIKWKLIEFVDITEDPCRQHFATLEELKTRINFAKNPWKLQTDKFSTLEVIRTNRSQNHDLTNEEYSEQPELLYAASSVDDDVLNRSQDNGFFHPLDPDRLRHNFRAQQQPKKENLLLVYSDQKLLASGEIKNGWKSEYQTGSTGKIHFETALDTGHLYTCDSASYWPKVSNDTMDVFKDIYNEDIGHANCSTDISDNCNEKQHFSVSHRLFIDIEITDEYEKKNPLSQSVMAKIMKMNFPITLTERSGATVAWDEEVPPTYSIVKGQMPPPQYTAV
ncbi:hypothetical protein DASC09_032310 [Saccharomycopsis crataegensis]|uniref:LDB19 N-terminal domain-containing protein n=1 Tax=Saccharomycopsis crataegensis TaxID=43959 RepID=A0AAV5QMG7_9ASCO|nr:hypothetical protein DASC09_032310 [Saccharomycopsis crataegensis]